MIGMVLAAGAGRRLGPMTRELPKALLAVDGKRTILDIVVSNLARAGVDEIVVITGYRADAIDSRAAELEAAHRVPVRTIHNDRGEVWNNAYSLWLGREHFARGVVLVNGDTVHPPTVEATLLAARGPGVLLAVDEAKELGDEEMKVQVTPQRQVLRISKRIDPAGAHGEYIGVSMIEPKIAGALADALCATWQADPSQYYEDGFQRLAAERGDVFATPIGAVDWVEVDDAHDLSRARDIACRC
jgi:choline kinase